MFDGCVTFKNADVHFGNFHQTTSVWRISNNIRVCKF